MALPFCSANSEEDNYNRLIIYIYTIVPSPNLSHHMPSFLGCSSRGSPRKGRCHGRSMVPSRFHLASSVLFLDSGHDSSLDSPYDFCARACRCLWLNQLFYSFVVMSCKCESISIGVEPMSPGLSFAPFSKDAVTHSWS